MFFIVKRKLSFKIYNENELVYDVIDILVHMDNFFYLSYGVKVVPIFHSGWYNFGVFMHKFSVLRMVKRMVFGDMDEDASVMSEFWEYLFYLIHAKITVPHISFIIVL